MWYLNLFVSSCNELIAVTRLFNHSRQAHILYMGYYQFIINNVDASSYARNWFILWIQRVPLFRR